MDYMRYRALHESRFFRSGRVGETWLLDTYLRAEDSRLHYLRNHQRKLHIAPESSINAAMHEAVKRYVCKQYVDAAIFTTYVICQSYRGRYIS